MAEVAHARAFSMAEQIEELKALADAEAEGRAEVERFVDESRDREKRIRRAVAVLEGTTQTAPAKAKPKPKGAAGRVSEANIAKVLAALREAGQPLTRLQLAERSGVVSSGVGYALVALRERELVRKAGKDMSATSPRKPDVYAPMPNDD